jgi:hypothetical protein
MCRAPSNVYFGATPYPSLSTVKNRRKKFLKQFNGMKFAYNIPSNLLCEPEEIAMKNLKNMFWNKNMKIV